AMASRVPGLSLSSRNDCMVGVSFARRTSSLSPSPCARRAPVAGGRWGLRPGGDPTPGPDSLILWLGSARRARWLRMTVAAQAEADLPFFLVGDGVSSAAAGIFLRRWSSG